MSPEEERRRLLEMENEFYGQFWQSAQSSDDFLDVFEATADSPPGHHVELPRSFSEGTAGVSRPFTVGFGWIWMELDGFGVP